MQTVAHRLDKMPSFLSQVIMTAAGLASVVMANNQGNYFPPTPEGLKVVESKHHEGVKISYKEVSFPFLLRIGKTAVD